MNEITLDVQTGIETVIKLSAEEIEKREAEAAKAEAAKAEAQAAKTADKTVLLNKLGITEDEAKLLLS